MYENKSIVRAPTLQTHKKEKRFNKLNEDKSLQHLRFSFPSTAHVVKV